MWITRVSIQNPVFATMIMVALLVLGLFSYQRLGVDQLPDIAFPIVVIRTAYPGASPETVEVDVTRKIEEAVNTVSGIKNLNSRSFEGLSTVTVEFDLLTDAAVAAQEVRDKVAAVKVAFRDEVEEPAVSRFNPDDSPILAIAVSSDTIDLRQLTAIADRVVARRLESVRGVGQASVVGGLLREIKINLRPRELEAYGIGVDEVIGVLRSENQELPAGALIEGNSESTVLIKGRIENPEEFGRIIVAQRGGAPVFLSQVADVLDGQQEEESVAMVDGQRAISINVIKTRGTNTIEVADGVYRALEDLRATLGSDVSVEVVRDASTGIRASVTNVRDTLLEGAVLTVAIVFLFLFSWRSTVITGLTLPISIIGTFIVMYMLGFTINVMTLMALSLSIGILIDDAIVVRENIVRHQAMGKSHKQAALEGTEEIGVAVMATTFTIVAVFLPVAFMGGMIGQFFFQFGVAVSTAVLLSLFVSFTLDPMLSSVWPEPKKATGKGRIARICAAHDRFLDSITDYYKSLLAWGLAHRKSVLGIATAALIGSFMLVPLIGVEFVAESDLGEAMITVKTPVGSSLEYTKEKVSQADAAFREFAVVTGTYATVNTGNSIGRNSGTIIAHLQDRHERTEKLSNLLPQFRERMNRIAGIEVSVALPSGMNAGKPVQVSIQGQDLKVLADMSVKALAAMAEVPGLVDMETSLEASRPTYDLQIDRQLASDLGISVDRISDTLRPLIAGEAVGSWRAPDGEVYDVRVQLPRVDRSDVANLDDVLLTSRDMRADGGSQLIPLRQVVSIEPGFGASQINRKDMRREVLISANVNNRPVGDVSTELRRVLTELPTPQGYKYVMTGASRDIDETMKYAGSALALAIIFIYLILASQFGSFLQPLAIMTSLPLALIGVFLALLICRSTLNIMSIIGFIMLMGLVTKNAILLVDFTNKARAGGLSRHPAIMEAGEVRLRPILMTTMAMVFGMMPLALGLGEGGSERAPMAHAVIGGLITSTLLTLLVVPVIYTYLDDFTVWIKKRRIARAPAVPVAS